MKSRFHFLVLVLLVLTSFVNTAQVANYEYGDVVDDFTVTDVKGNIWNLYDITAGGKYVYLDFFFVDCVPCQLTQSIFNEVYDKYGCNGGDLFLISINRGTDTNAEVIAYENEYGGPFNHAPAVGMEGGCEAVTNNFGIFGYPSYLLISPENIYLSRLEGTPGNITVETFENYFPTGFNPEPMPCNLGVGGSTAPFDFKVFPNPNNGKSITLIVQDFHLKSEVTIYNTLGQVVFSKVVDGVSTVLEPNLTAGNYYIQLVTQEDRFIKNLLVK